MGFPTMWYVPPYSQSDHSLCKSLEHSMTVKLVVEQHLEFLGLKLAAQARLSPHLLKFHIVGNHMSRLIWASTRKNLSFGGLRTTKAQTSLRMRAVRSAPL